MSRMAIGCRHRPLIILEGMCDGFDPQTFIERVIPVDGILAPMRQPVARCARGKRSCEKMSVEHA